MSICIVSDNKDNRKDLERLEKIASTGGKLFKINGKALAEQDQNQLVHTFRIERDKQYDEILEECQEYIDEILLNIKERKTSQEEVEEMEESLDGLKRWLDRVKSIDWVENSAASIRVEKLLDKCEATLHKYIELAHPKKSNYSH